ncbi:unnamed protein product, partial [Nesidiocoris tenuis]
MFRNDRRIPKGNPIPSPAYCVPLYPTSPESPDYSNINIPGEIPTREPEALDQ